MASREDMTGIELLAESPITTADLVRIAQGHHNLATVYRRVSHREGRDCAIIEVACTALERLLEADKLKHALWSFHGHLDPEKAASLGDDLRAWLLGKKEIP